MTYIKLKIVALCLNTKEKEKIFSYLESTGASVQDHSINYETNELITWLHVAKDVEPKFNKAIDEKKEQFFRPQEERGYVPKKDKREITCLMVK